jgi:hypothetical protein
VHAFCLASTSEYAIGSTTVSSFSFMSHENVHQPCGRRPGAVTYVQEVIISLVGVCWFVLRVIDQDQSGKSGYYIKL